MIDKITREEHKMDAKLSDKVFRDVIDVLNKREVKYWLEYGTVLGAIREGDWISTDFDIDIGIVKGTYDNRFLDDLRKIGLIFDSDCFDVGNNKFIRKSNILINSFCNRFTKLEFSFYYRIDDYYWKLTQQKEDGIYGTKTPAIYIDNLKPYYFKDRYVKIPNNVEAYLEYHYGDWKTPKMDISETYKKDFIKVDEDKLIKQNTI